MSYASRGLYSITGISQGQVGRGVTHAASFNNALEHGFVGSHLARESIGGCAASSLESRSVSHVGEESVHIGHSIGRITLLKLLVALLIAFLIAHSYSLSQSIERYQTLSSVELGYVTVTSGDTLWAISEAHPIEGMSTYEVVNYLSEINGLERSGLMPGMRLRVPVQ